MPDIGLTWDSDTTNNYYEIIPDEPPDYPIVTGDINITVEVDITRPLVPEFTTSSRWLYIDVGNMTTTVEALPSEYVEGAQTLQDMTDDIFDDLGLIPVFVGLALFGIAVSVLFKGV